jgi:glycosyltransferase involved in cell wall biosynthesis
MNILVVQDTDWLLRGPHQQHHLLERLALKGHKIRVIDYEILWRFKGAKGLYSKRQIFPDISKIYTGANITLVRPGIIKIPWLDYVSLFFAYRKEIERQRKEFAPDVIVGLGILGSYLAIKTAQRHEIPFIYYWVDVLHRLMPSKAFQSIAKVLERSTLKKSDAILAINQELRKCVIGIGAAPGRTFILRSGIDLEKFNPAMTDGTIVRRQYALKKSDVVLFYMGWLYHFSGLKEVARQLAKAGDKRLKLLVVGEGDAYEDLRQILDKYKLHDRIILTGKKPYTEMPAFIAAADVCLLPAYQTEKIMQDIVPIKMYEYMAMAKPVIATALPGVVEEFGEDSGIVYIDKPEDTLEKAIQLVQDNKLKSLGAKARNFVQKYDWQQITDEFEKVLGEVISKKCQTNKR